MAALIQILLYRVSRVAVKITFDKEQLTGSLKIIREAAGPGEASVIQRATRFCQLLQRNARRFHERRQTALDRNWAYLSDASRSTLARHVFDPGPMSVPPPGAPFFFGVEPEDELLALMGYRPDLDPESYVASLFDGYRGTRNFPDFCATAIYFAPIKEFKIVRIVPSSGIVASIKELADRSAGFRDWTTLAPSYAAARK
ncbi:MAG: hypothetical protein ACFE0P_10645 [Oceanicaulis sp.]